MTQHLIITVLSVMMLGCSLTRPYAQGKIEEDSRHPASTQHSGPGDLPVTSYQARVHSPDGYMNLMVYQPARFPLKAPAVILLPGVMASDDQYESYARALASRGMVVALRDWYSYFHEDIQLARDAITIKEWLITNKKADAKRIALVGHSMGAKDAMLAGLMDPDFSTIIAIDPDNQGAPSVATPALGGLKPSLFLIGAEVSWKGPDICAPKDENYEVFYEYAPKGTLELTLKDADHVQMLDDPDRFGYNFCRVGTANSDETRILARGAVVAYLDERLLGGTPTLNQVAPRNSLRQKN